MSGLANVGVFRRLVCLQHHRAAHFVKQLSAVEDAVISFKDIQKHTGEWRMAAIAFVGNRLQPT